MIAGSFFYGGQTLAANLASIKSLNLEKIGHERKNMEALIRIGQVFWKPIKSIWHGLNKFMA